MHRGARNEEATNRNIRRRHRRRRERESHDGISIKKAIE
jgi:hypothetical protein